MNRVYAFQKARRCSATSKRTGKPCQAPAVRGWAVCRFHGARGGAPKGAQNGSYKHGLYMKEAIEARRALSALFRGPRTPKQLHKAMTAAEMAECPNQGRSLPRTDTTEPAKVFSHNQDPKQSFTPG